MKVFVTGDRSLPKMVAVFAATAAINAAASKWADLNEIEWETGDQPGVEDAVRYLLEGQVSIVETAHHGDGRPDFDRRHEIVASDCDAAVVIHGDPMSSRITKSLLEAYGDRADERVLLVTG